MKRIRLLLLLMAFFAAALAGGEEAAKNELFLDTLPDKGVRVLAEFRDAVRRKDASAAARLFQKLHSQWADKLVEGSEKGLYVPLSNEIVPEFLSLGEAAAAAFREQFDPLAARLIEGARAGDPTQAAALLRAYPFSGYAAEAHMILAVWNADEGRFPVAARHLETLLADFPDYARTHPAAAALLIRCYSGNGDKGSLEALKERLGKVGMLDLAFRSSKLGELLDAALRSAAGGPGSDGWPSPGGAPSGVRPFSVSVRRPALLWSASVVPDPLFEDSAVERPFRPFVDPASPPVTVSVAPVLHGGRLFLQSGTYVYARDLETGFFLQRYPVGRNMEEESRVPVFPSQSALYSLSVWKGNLYAFFSQTGSLYVRGRGSLEAYRIEGGDRVFDGLTIRRRSGREADAAALASMSFVSVPLACGGQVFALGVVRGGMGDVYALSLDASTGGLLWMRRVFTYALPRTTSAELAVTVPAAAAGKVVFHFRGGVFCLSASDGSVLWLNSYESSTMRTGGVYPPALFPELDTALVFPPDSNGIYAYSLSDGRLLWKTALAGRAFMGVSGGRAWFQSGPGVTALDLKDGSGVLSFRVQPEGEKGGVNGTGAVAGGTVILPLTGGLAFFDARTGDELGRFLFPSLAGCYLGRVFPFGDRIICATPEAIYCFTDRDSFLAAMARAEERSPGDPVPHYRTGILYLNSGEFEKALAELKAALDSAKEDDTYLGYPLRTLIRARLSLYYRMLAERETEPEKVYLQASEGLKFADSPYDRAFLEQLMAASALRAGKREEAFAALVDMLAGCADAAAPEREFKAALKEAGLSDEATGSSVSLRELCTAAVDRLATSRPELAEPYERKAAELAEAALAGDPKAASEVLGALFFTKRAVRLAGEFVSLAVSGKLPAEMKEVLSSSTAAFPVDRSPQLAFARALLSREECPALCDRVMADLARFYPDAVVDLPDGPKTLAELARAHVPPEQPARSEERPDVSGGLETAWRLKLARKRIYFNPPLLACKGGVALPLGEKNALTFLSGEDGSVRWSVEVPDRAFIGVSLDDSAVPAGALVVSLVPGYPAEAAGVQPGDVIVEFAGRKVTSHMKLVEAISSVRPGEPTTMKVLRNGEELVIRITPTVRKGDEFVPDMIMGLFESRSGKVVALRRSFLSSTFHFEAFDEATGELAWRRTFEDMGYPGSFERMGDLVALFCTPLRRGQKGTVLFFDLDTGRWRAVSLAGNYYHKIYAFSGPRMAMVVYDGSESSVSVFDVLSGARALVFRPRNRGIFGTGGFAGRFMPYNEGPDLYLLDLFNGRTAKGPKGARVVYLDGDEALLYLSDGTLGSARLGPEEPPPESFFPPLGRFPSQSVKAAGRFGVFFNRFQYFLQSTRLMFAQFEVADPVSRRLRHGRAMPTGSYVRRVFSSAGLVFADYNGQLERYKGLVVVDPVSGKLVLRHMAPSSSGVNAAVGGGMLFVDDGEYLTAYRPATPEGRRKLAERAKELENSDEPDPLDVLSLCQQMLNAHMPAECVKFCDRMLFSSADLPASQVEGWRGLAREDLFESRPRPVLDAPKLPVKVDGDLSEWGDDGWRFLGKDSTASCFFKWRPPESAADLSVAFKTARSGDGLCVAVRITDDVLVTSEDNEGDPWTSDHVELFACPAGGFEGDYPPGGALWLSLSPSADGLDLERFITPGSGRSPAPVDYEKHPIRAAFTRRGSVMCYEVFIPLWYFAETPEGADPSLIAFNLMAVDRDKVRMDAPVRVLELAPTFSPHLYSYMRVSLFPRIALTGGEGGGK